MIAKLDAIEDKLVVRRSDAGPRYVVEPPRLTSAYDFLHGATNGIRPEVTDGVRAVYAELSSQWATYKSQLDDLLGPSVGAFNKLVLNEHRPAVVPPEQ